MWGHCALPNHTLNLSDCIDQPEVLRRLRRGFLEQQEPGRDTALRLHVLSGHFGAEELQALAAEVLESVEGVHLDKLRVAPPRRQSDAGVDDLVRLMREELRAPGLRLAAQQILEDLRAVLPREVADTLGEDALDDLLDEAVDAVAIAQHSGGSS